MLAHKTGIARTTTASEDVWMASNGTTMKDWDFYLDCACSAHVSSRRDVFVEFTAIPEGTRPVKGFEGSVFYARGQGNIELKMRLPNSGSRDVTIRNFLYIPGSVNIISQGMLMELGLRIVPANGYGINIYNKDNCLVACAPQVARMFPFDLILPEAAGIGPELSTLTALKATGQANGGETQLRLWHRRIAHLGIASLKALPSMVGGVPALQGNCDCIHG